MKPARHYLVIAKTNGIYVLATRRTFKTWAEATLFMANLSLAREPIVVLVD